VYSSALCNDYHFPISPDSQDRGYGPGHQPPGGMQAGGKMVL